MKNRTSENIDEAKKNIEDYEKQRNFWKRKVTALKTMSPKRIEESPRPVDLLRIGNSRLYHAGKSEYFTCYRFCGNYVHNMAKSKPTVHIRVKEEEKPDESSRKSIQLNSIENDSLEITKTPNLIGLGKNRIRVFNFIKNTTALYKV